MSRIRINTWLIMVAAVASLCLQSTTTFAFDTLEGDRTNWSNNPSFSTGRLSPEIANQAQLAAIRAGFRAWSSVGGSSLAFDEVANGGDITVDFLDRWPAEFGRYAAGITQTSRRRGALVSAVISLNEQNFEWSTTPNGDQSDVQGVLTHEVGHAIGLSHSFHREATMYWTGGDIALRSLSADDERGVRFLYGDAGGQGQFCDLCESHDDCLVGSFCLALEDNHAFCGAPCGRGCPENSECINLQSGDQSCVPIGRGCSDEAPGPFDDGDYCYGTAQCGNDMMCLPLIDSARCVRTCQPGGAPCRVGECVGGGNGQPGICMTPGDRGYGEACESNLDCSSLSCIPIEGGRSICTVECNPERNDCPEGRCVRIRGEENSGICIPPGDVPEGAACGFLADRCMAGLGCIDEGRSSICRRICVPFGDCPAGQGCSPTESDTWACYPTGPFGLGEACDRPQCGGGRTCAPTGPREAPICAEICQVGMQAHCGRGTCIDYGGEYGVCPQGTVQFGVACEAANECLSGACVWTPDGNQCSLACAGPADCPEGWACREYSNSLMACFRDSPSPGGAGGTGGQGSGGQAGEPGAGGQPGNGGAGGSSGSGQAGGAGGQPQMGAGGSGTEPPAGTGGSPEVMMTPDGGQPTSNGNTGQAPGPGRVLVSTRDDGGCSTSGDSPGSLPLFLFIICVSLGRRRLNCSERTASRDIITSTVRESHNA